MKEQVTLCKCCCTGKKQKQLLNQEMYVTAISFLKRSDLEEKNICKTFFFLQSVFVPLKYIKLFSKHFLATGCRIWVWLQTELVHNRFTQNLETCKLISPFFSSTFIKYELFFVLIFVVLSIQGNPVFLKIENSFKLIKQRVIIILYKHLLQC